MADIEYVYYDMRTDTAYRADGSEIANDNILDFPYKSQRRIYFQLLNSYDGDNDFSDVYTSLVGVAVTATAAIDNDANHYDDGELTASATGAKTTLTVDGLTDTPRIMGTLKLTNATAQTETVNYSSWTLAGSVYTFVLADVNFTPGAQTLTYTYANDDDVRVLQLPITKDASVDVTNKDTGLFIIDLDCYKAIFQELIEDSEEITGCKLELQVIDSTTYPVIAKRIPVRCSYLLDDDSGNVGGAPPSSFYTSAQVDVIIAALGPFTSISVNCKSAASTTIYTVPTGKLFRATRNHQRVTAISGSGTLGSYKIKADSTELMTARALTKTVVNEADVDSFGDEKFWPAGTVFAVEIASATTGYTTHTTKATLEGVLIDA